MTDLNLSGESPNVKIHNNKQPSPQQAGGHGPGIDNPLSFYLTSTAQPDLDGSYFFGMNAKGDVMSLTDSSGNLAEDYEFDPWGQVIQGDSSLNNILFAACEYDPEMGLYFNRARYYDPGLGRFTQRDLIFNPSDNFRYVFNMPTIFRDPEGLRPPIWGKWGDVRWIKPFDPRPEPGSDPYSKCLNDCYKQYEYWLMTCYLKPVSKDPGNPAPAECEIKMEFYQNCRCQCHAMYEKDEAYRKECY